MAQLDNHVVPAEFVISRDRAAIDEVLAWARVSLAARAAGVAAAAMEYAEHYGKERVQFGQPIGTFESLIRLRDDSQTNTLAARLLAVNAAWAIDKGHANAADLASRARQLRAAVKTTFLPSGQTPPLRPGLWAPNLTEP